MKTLFRVGFFLLVWLEACCLGAVQSQIWYSTEDLGAGRWQYTYQVVNVSLTYPGLPPIDRPIEEFTLWFNYGLYDNLTVETPPVLPPGGWDEIVIQPEPVLEDDGVYDAKALGLGIEIGRTAGPFAVGFNWLGDALMPGPQFYEIIDPVTFETIDSGMTKLIPEPATLLLLGLGGLALLRKRRTLQLRRKT